VTQHRASADRSTVEADEGLPVGITTARGPLLELSARGGKLTLTINGVASTELDPAVGGDELLQALPAVIAQAQAQCPDSFDVVVSLRPRR
jgi:hypothetical protein